MPAISVILCTYNSEAYIRPLVDSILSGDFGDLELLVQDDCSSDGTVSILRSYGDSRIRIRVNEKPSGSAAMNFMTSLLNWDTSPYVMFADADDYWEPDKISRTFARMKEAEARLKHGWVTVQGASTVVKEEDQNG